MPEFAIQTKDVLDKLRSMKMLETSIIWRYVVCKML